MTTVIVPLDGSVDAEAALPYARTLAGPDGRLVLVISVWRGEPPAPRQYLEDRALQLAGDPVESRVVLDREPSEAILLTARELPTALVCMAAHGRGALGQAVLGSTAEAVIRGSDRPLLLVGPRASYSASRAGAANLVVAVDTDETAARLAPHAARLAGRHHLHPWVVESVGPAPYPFAVDPAAPERLAEAAAVAHAAELLAAEGQTADTKVLIANDPADGIVAFARDLPASYVVMGAHARSGVARFALGSVTMRVVHRSPCPVLVVRP
jgi:nucleotide-binding universal stress UspA family protein